MNDPFARLRNASRTWLSLLWRGYQLGERLHGEEARFARCMAAHPEWTEWWERGDDVGDAEVVTPDGVDPYLAVALEATVEGMIAKGGDKHARRAYRQLRREGLSHVEARAEIGRVFTGVLWAEGAGRIPVGKGPQVFHTYLRRLMAGESASGIFNVDPEET
jgi:hypothetical protein